MQSPPLISVVIPARYASSRFPGKPLVHIDGISLLERTYKRVLLSPIVSNCYIATDNEEIAKHVRDFGGSVVMTSLNCMNGTDRVAEAVKNEPNLQKSSIIVNVQGDEPCLDPHNIKAVVQALSNTPNASIGTAISPIINEKDMENRNIVKCVHSLDGRALYFSRAPIPCRQKESSIQSFRHIGIYAFRPNFLSTFLSLTPTPLQQVEDLEMLKAIEHGYTVAVAKVSSCTPEVNVPEDIKEVEKWIQSFCSSQEV